MKRTFDFLVSLLLLVLFSPVMLLLAIVIRLTMGAPVLFRQVRPGFHARPFELLKFRTMNDARDSRGELLHDAQRLTATGRFLRRTSLDELPQLWNVLRGDMSLVGPRPLLMEYLDRYTPEQARRHDVLPGITGSAQISGRQDIPFSRRLELDVWYVEHRSFWLDLKIMLATLPHALRSTGVRSGQDVLEVDDLGLSAKARDRGEDSK
jgi:sugar transferase EpsL